MLQQNPNRHKRVELWAKSIKDFGNFRPGSDAVLHMSRIEFEFRPTQINLDRLN